MSAARSQALSDHTNDSDRCARLVDELDQQLVGEGDTAWTVHVMGVHESGADLWIQVSADPDGYDGFVLRLSRWATAEHALAALAAARPAAHFPRIVAVMQPLDRSTH
jgi:hypothetical protein